MPGVEGAAARQRGRYGIDAPSVALGLSLGATGLAGAGLALGAPTMILGSLVMAASVASFVFTTRVGKFQLWRALLAGLPLDGDERVLDLGCGRGAVLTMVAQLVPSGRAVGVDLWRSADQSGNTKGAARRNAERERVAERVDLHTADMRKLPFEDECFDVVVSSLALHNLADREDRRAALAEASRVLHSDGRLLIADIKAVGEYAAGLRELGMVDVTTRRLGWRGWYGGPWMAMSAVTARKA